MVLSDNPPRPEGLPAGYDGESPYEDEEISNYPDWWRKNIENFREHGMRPYRPPRFLDGEFVPPFIADLEDQKQVKIFIRSINPAVGDDWTLIIDNQEVATIGRHRSGNGYTVYELSSTEFESLIRTAIE